MERGLSANRGYQRSAGFEDSPKHPERHVEGETGPESSSSNSCLSSAATVKITDGFGCVHYRRRCRLLAPCCDKLYVCRVCHDEEQEHKLDRRQVRTIQCMSCLHSQPVSNQCTNCGIKFASYFCEICRLFAGVDSGPIFHCEGCGICRKGSKETVIHCTRCQSCVQRDTWDRHRCRPYSLHDDCPICCEGMFHARERAVHLPCAHAMHKACFEDWMKYDYRCPTCFKAVIEPRDYFSRIKKYVQKYEPEPRNVGRTVTIFCNECEKTSIVKYHPEYKECPQCKGYNTAETKSTRT